jgi:hypothetical protein
MSNDTNWPRQGDLKATNVLILRQVLDLLYQTHITEQSTATLRGNAVQSVNAMLLEFGVNDGIAKLEKVPWSKRIRESEIWKGEDDV